MPVQRLLSTSVALGGLFALAGLSIADAQEANGPAGNPRSTNNRVTDESATPPPVNSDYRKAAEGTLPKVPGTNVVAPSAPGAGLGTGGKVGSGAGGAADPATPLIPGRVSDGQGDPAGGLQPGARNLDIERTGVNRAGAMVPSGLDVAMLIEHAVSMSIEASALQAIAEQSPDDDASKTLLDHAKKEMTEAKAMLAKAGSDGSGIPAGSPTRKFYGAANVYMTTLGQLCNPSTPPTPMDKAQVAMVNHSIHHVLDADHIRQYGQASAGSPATDQLLQHAEMMKRSGTDALGKIAGDGTSDPAAPPSAVLLAQQGRDLIAAAAQVGTSMGPSRMSPNVSGRTGNPNASGASGTGVSPLPAEPNPARLRDTRPEIIGGTQATGSPTAGTATGAEAASNVKNSKELPNGQLIVPEANSKPGAATSNYGEGNNNTPPTNSSAGSRPR